MPKLKDIMVGEVITIEANATVRNAVRLMNKREIGCLVVVQDGRPTGIVTERDMMKRVLVAARDPRAVEVAEVMSKPLLFMEPEKEIEDAVKLMFKHKIKKLPVIENGRLVGLVTLTDLINCMHTSVKKTLRGMEKAIDARARGLSALPSKTEVVQKAFGLDYPDDCDDMLPIKGKPNLRECICPARDRPIDVPRDKRTGKFIIDNPKKCWRCRARGYRKIKARSIVKEKKRKG